MLSPLMQISIVFISERFTIYPSQTGSVQLTLPLLNNIGVFLEKNRIMASSDRTRNKLV